MSDKTILIVDDERAVREQLAKVLKDEGWIVLSRSSGKDLSQSFLENVQLAIVNIRLPQDPQGDEIARSIHRWTDKRVPVMILTGFGNVDQAVSMTKEGIEDYVCKPLDNDDLVRRCRLLLEIEDKRAEVTRLRRALEERSRHSLGGSPAVVLDARMKQTIADIERYIAKSQMPVLIVGDTGTGKEAIAKQIHDDSGLDKFVAINCAAFTDTLLMSELFGHVKGAFTGATAKKQGLLMAADGGTLFLDEIGELSPEAQAAIFRFADGYGVRPVGSAEQPQHPKVRIIAATNRRDALFSAPDPNQDSQQVPTFRTDLLWQLAGWIIEVPALDHREDDALGAATERAKRFGEGKSAPNAKKSFVFSTQAHETLRQMVREHRFSGVAPLSSGNFRNLNWLVDRACWITTTEKPDTNVVEEDAILRAAAVVMELQKKHAGVASRVDTSAGRLVGRQPPALLYVLQLRSRAPDATRDASDGSGREQARVDDRGDRGTGARRGCGDPEVNEDVIPRAAMCP